MNVRVKRMREARHPLPKYATVGSTGVDFYAYTDGAIVLNPGQRTLIPLGLSMSIPQGFELQLVPRSGLALKNGITLTNSPGKIDSDYRGEIGAIVQNLGADVFVINDGDKICQGGFYEVERVEFCEVEELDETDRGERGFGHSGV